MAAYIMLAAVHMLWFTALAAMITIAYRDEEPYSERMVEAVFALLIAAIYVMIVIG